MNDRFITLIITTDLTGVIQFQSIYLNLFTNILLVCLDKIILIILKLINWLWMEILIFNDNDISAVTVF